MYEIYQIIPNYLNRKTICRLRSVSREARDVIKKPKPFKKVNTTSIAKVKMILNIGNTLGNVLITNKNNVHRLCEIVILYKYSEFTYTNMMNDFKWFRDSILARLFFMIHKYREYDSKFIPNFHGYQYNIQLGPIRANEILNAKSSDEVISPTFIHGQIKNKHA